MAKLLEQLRALRRKMGDQAGDRRDPDGGAPGPEAVALAREAERLLLLLRSALAENP